jgi:hypothetical protein
MFELACLPTMGFYYKKVSTMAKLHFEKLFLMKRFVFCRVLPIMQGVGMPHNLILDADENFEAKVRKEKCLSYELKIV